MPSKFQHRHYAAIADVLADARDPNENGGLELPGRELDMIARIEGLLIRMFERDNDGFSPDRFRAAARRAPNMHGKDKVA